MLGKLQSEEDILDMNFQLKQNRPIKIWEVQYKLYRETKMDPYRVALFAVKWQPIPDVSQALYDIKDPKI